MNCCHTSCHFDCDSSCVLSQSKTRLFLELYRQCSFNSKDFWAHQITYACILYCHDLGGIGDTYLMSHKAFCQQIHLSSAHCLWRAQADRQVLALFWTLLCCAVTAVHSIDCCLASGCERVLSQTSCCYSVLSFSKYLQNCIMAISTNQFYEDSSKYVTPHKKRSIQRPPSESQTHSFVQNYAESMGRTRHRQSDKGLFIFICIVVVCSIDCNLI